MPDFAIVDSHVHLYDLERLSYAWLEGRPPINRTHLLDDYDRARGKVAVDRIVFAEVAVDAGLHLDEAAWAQSLADGDPRLCGLIAHAPLEKGAAVAADLGRLAAHRNVKGVRRLLETEVDQAFCLEPGFIAGLRLLPGHGLTFDICVKHWGLVFAHELARRCPEVTFILDHLGKPGIRHGLKEPWWSEMRQLGRLSNMMCKVSGAITEADHEHWTADDVTPYVAHAIDCFGFDKVMFGSDWSVSTLTHAYPRWVEIVDQVVAGCSAEEIRKLYRDTAIRTYRLGE